MLQVYQSIFSFFALALSLNCSACAYQGNLEESPQTFVLDIKRIRIPGHSTAFNPSIVRWNGRLLMCFREIIEIQKVVSSQVFCSAESRLGLVFLDEEFNPVGEVQLLDLCTEEISSRVDDPRLVIVGEKLFLIYSDNIDKEVTQGGFRVYVVELAFNGLVFEIEQQEKMSQFQNEDQHRREKNWSPFEYSGSLLLVYSLSPHKVLYPLLGLETCVTIGNTWPELFWKWGELRGGTPAILVEGEYLSFFHSSLDMISDHSQGESALHYFMGAYTFRNELPFAITGMSLEPIVAKGFYSGESYQPYWKPVQVVFPCGLIEEGPYLWVTYGRQDHEMWVAKIDKRGLLDSLWPVDLKD